ncbi:hypothetical protein L2E82_18201 [Cichorium intybus]|uniref:Uncharacterized protein n=1 Tax=Cichorium intybus TaxID=13427 RepID=A0ACB9FAI2_CICIN|nr:hypothetical protein L2E82_18201 [Cichorium intybus]
MIDQQPGKRWTARKTMDSQENDGQPWKILLPITLWNQFNEHQGNMLQSMTETTPLIFGLRLGVTTFNSVSLTTKSTSVFLINPPVSEDLQLRQWYDNHRTEIQELVRTRNFRNNELLLPYPNDEDTTSIIKAVESFENSKTAWVTGKITLPVQERGFSYTACANCQKPLEADITWIVTCPSCRVESEIIAMSRMTVTIYDGTGTIQATMYTPDMDKFIPFTATKLKESEEMGKNLHDAIAAVVQSSPITAFIRAYTTHYRGTD